jgi:G2/mitotic-specific cyclin 2
LLTHHSDQDEAFVFYSSFTEAQLEQGHAYLIGALSSSGFDQRYVSKKYASKKFLKASVFAREWAKAAQAHAIAEAESAGEEMILDRDE